VKKDIETMSILDWALYYKRTSGFNIVVVHYKGKCPPKGVDWKQYEEQPATEELLREWFGDGKYRNLGVIAGPTSNNLTILDFDSPAAYKWWAEQNSELAKTIPTVKSSRGYQSTHESGIKYEWIIPLPENGVLPKLNPLDWQLQLFTEETEEIQDKEDIEDIDSKKGGLLENDNIYTNNQIKKAILTTLPKSENQRNRKIFEFCRRLKAIPEFADCKAKQVKSIVNNWHKMALSVIGTKPFDKTWADFVYGWDRVKWPQGDDTLKKAVELALDAKDRPEAEQYDSIEVQLLIRVCYELQQLQGEEAFWLSCHSAAGILGVSHTEANKMLQMLVADEILKVVEKNTTTKATRYRYIGGGKESEEG
jgi:hypothetical protein